MYQKLKKQNKIVVLCAFVAVIVLVIIIKFYVDYNQSLISNNSRDTTKIGLDDVLSDKALGSSGNGNKICAKTDSRGIESNRGSMSTSSINSSTTDAKTINARDYGARGDGVTDDTSALQSAIEYASKNKITLLIPRTESCYKILGSLSLKSNLHIIGYGATIFMPSQDVPKAMMISKEDTYISNVTVDGLSFRSKNDKTGTGYWAHSLTSNVQGVYVLGVNCLRLNDVNMYDMYNGLKLGASLTGRDNLDVKIDNLNVINSSTPLLMGQTNGFTMTNSTLDADAGNSHWLHSAYIDWGNTNVLFDNVKFINAPGAGVSIGDSYEDRADPSHIVIKNSLIENANRGFNLYGTTNVGVHNVEIKKCNLAFSIHDAKLIDISKVSISESKTDIANGTIAPDMGAFQLDEAHQTNIRDITINADTMGGSLFTLKNKNEHINISNLSVVNMNDIGFFYNNSQTASFVVELSNFEWTKITNPRLSFRGYGASAVFRNNNFKNKGSQYLAVADNYTGTSISLNNNSYSGFSSLAYSSDYSKTLNNLNLDTGAYDIEK